MSDSLPLDTTTSTLGRALWNAARAEAPSADVSAKLLRTLGIGSGVLAAAGAAHASAVGMAASAPAAATTAVGVGSTALSASAAIVLKWAGLGLVAGAVAVGTGTELAGPPPRPHDSVVTESRSVATPATSSKGPAPAPVPTVSTDLEQRQPPGPAPQPPRSVGSFARAAPEAPPGSTLTDEVATLERARSLLSRGDTTGTLDALGQYDAAHPTGRLSVEAATLRMQALYRAGHRLAAAAVARRLLSLYPKGAHAALARSIAEADGGKAGSSRSGDGMEETRR